MPDWLVELLQIFRAKLRDEPNADEAQLLAHLKQEIAANPKLATAIQTDSRISQINQGNTIAFQTEVKGGRVYISKDHIHVDAVHVDAEAITKVLPELFIKVLQELL